jgi:hypothetical protein
MIALLLWLAVQQPTLDELVVRAQAYVLDFQKQLAGVVAEEAYTQDYRSFRRGASTTALSPSIHRELKSDVLMVKPQGGDRWLQFRDVFEVDGKPVRNRSERLMDLFVNPTASTKSHAERIVEESARYNVGGIERNINVPMLALTILLPENVGRFQFKAATKLDGELIKQPERSLSVVEFQERRKGTMIHGPGNADMPSSGRLWIDSKTGRIAMTELTVDTASLRATISVRYEAPAGGPLAGVSLPAEMRELYEQVGFGSRISGAATYGRFRQFQVSVDEQMAPIKK